MTRRSAAVRRSTLSALRWCRFYTRGLDTLAASDRADEIASDLHEHALWAEERGESPARTARAIRSRVLRGAGADLLWRRARLREGSTEALFDGRVGSLSAGLQAVALLLVLASVLVGGWASIRVTTESTVPLPTLLPVPVATLIAAVGLLLLAGRRTRIAGALLGAVGVSVLPTVAVDALWYVSATVPVLVSTVPALDLGLLLLGNAQGLILLAAVLCWSIERRRPEGAVAA
ncbi:hypothetical protein ASF48_18525 [Rathayibacter sp. Leaf299]|uniref:hypothetical protein n=1 Tax=Rathayibacter sp. Leaf299 TaxID=1736328 RepID=UPI0006FA356F|nr:hypothetical protein [Rathayibacter sp. Leaf299]KQQ18398.1 hypothetical protein ASF48_18525 [Rathayibacter sp. Leaf299]